MSSTVDSSLEVETPQVNALQIIKESEMENNRIIEKKVPISLVKQVYERSIGSFDSDVSLTYEETSDEKEDDNQGGEKSLMYNDSTGSVSDDNGSNGKDSGCEVSGNQETDEKLNESDKSEEEKFVPPDDELANKIVAQVEFYFSDANITKDAFLLKHVKRNKEGYVSLKLISSFKRVKHLAKDWWVVAYALKKSTKLEVNEAQTKLRRVDPLPAFDQTTPSRTIVAINLPMEKPTIESVAEIFRGFGEISLIRILRPGNSVPADVRSFANKHPEMQGCISALIEFDRTESAKLAIERLDNDWRSGVHGMKVLELNAPPSDKKKRIFSKKTALYRVKDNDLSSSCQSSSEAEVEAKFRQRRSSSPHPTRVPDIPRLQRRYSANRDLGTNYINSELYREKPSCTCCNHCEKKYYSSGSDYDSPAPPNFRMLPLPKEAQENYYQIPAVRRFSGVDNSCCFLRRCSRDSGSESSGSFTRPHDFTRRFSRDSISSTESGFQRRFSRDSISSESIGSFRRFSKDSVSSDVFAPPFLSRSNSRDVIELPRRSSFGAINTTFDRHPLVHSGSRSSFTIPSHCVTNHSPHVPENVIRMPKGPDGSKGFVTVQ